MIICVREARSFPNRMPVGESVLAIWPSTLPHILLSSVEPHKPRANIKSLPNHLGLISIVQFACRDAAADSIFGCAQWSSDFAILTRFTSSADCAHGVCQHMRFDQQMKINGPLDDNFPHFVRMIHSTAQYRNHNGLLYVMPMVVAQICTNGDGKRLHRREFYLTRSRQRLRFNEQTAEPTYYIFIYVLCECETQPFRRQRR